MEPMTTYEPFVVTEALEKYFKSKRFTPRERINRIKALQDITVKGKSISEVVGWWMILEHPDLADMSKEEMQKLRNRYRTQLATMIKRSTLPTE